MSSACICVRQGTSDNYMRTLLNMEKQCVSGSYYALIQNYSSVICHGGKYTQPGLSLPCWALKAELD